MFYYRPAGTICGAGHSDHEREDDRDPTTGGLYGHGRHRWTTLAMRWRWLRT